MAEELLKAPVPEGYTVDNLKTLFSLHHPDVPVAGDGNGKVQGLIRALRATLTSTPAAPVRRA